MHERQVPVVAGSMISLSSGFWSEYVDTNALGSKTPRMDRPYLITEATLGKPGYKLPITANVFLLKEVFDVAGGLHEQFTQTYDDYVWFRDIIAAGYDIWCDARLAAYHRHREGFRDLVREYWSAGCGLMDYLVLYPADGFSRARSRQLGLMLYTVIAGGLGIAFAPLLVVAAVLVAGILVSMVSAFITKSVSGLLFPAVTSILVMAFVYGVGYRLARQTWRGVIPTEIVSVHYLRFLPEAAHVKV
jgi:hypothetical protein